MLYIFVILLTFAGKFFLFSVENSWNQLNTDFSYFPLKTKFRKLQNRYRMNLLKEGVDGFSSFLWFSGLFFFCKQNYPSDWFLCFQPFPVKFSNDLCSSLWSPLVFLIYVQICHLQECFLHDPLQDFLFYDDCKGIYC
jgi:hypothetical protein